MSRPRIPNKFSAAQPPKTPNYGLIPTKRPHPLSSRPDPMIYLANGQSFTQDSTLPTKIGQVGFRDPPPRDLPVLNKRKRAEESSKDEEQPTWVLEDVAEAGISPHANKRSKQSRRWMKDVIPQLISPYTELLRETDNLHEDPVPCLSEITLEICQCTPAGVQLVQMGLFPCTPCYPSLAVDIKILEFVRGLFLRVAPNHRAWCDTVTEFLDGQGFRMAGKNALKHATKGLVDGIVRRFRQQRTSFDEGQSASSSRPPSSMSEYEFPPDTSPPSSRPASPSGDGDDDDEDLPETYIDDRRSPEDNEEANTKRARFDNTALNLTAPSEYLRSRCPLCFGGAYFSRNGELEYVPPHLFDACFTQKHNKTRGRDPLKKHPDSLFVSEEELREAEEYVEDLRPSNPKSKKEDEGEEDGEDGYEGTMRVPRSALNGCHESFTAADERRQKASTQFFDCTGLMALMCRHDRVLWLANMTSAGEKQFYVIALLRKLFQNLPDDFLVGLLYDIGCQLDRSCEKWDFLEEFRDRIAFAISVFHAFGHHWACQLVYHPRKRKGFGLSDGEGCERFWHSISRLIPYLRVCGYYQRLYTLDCQVEHQDNENLQGLATWLTRKLSDAQAAEILGRREMEDLGESEAFLRESQVEEQTKPLPKRSNQLGKKAVEEVMRLRTAVEMLEKKVRELEDVVLDLDADELEHAQAVQHLPDAQRKLADARRKRKSKEQLLGVKESQAVRHLVASPFLRD
ncbi:hypothetical protein V5O48_010673, partial [Marasmius crinis-equi]